MSAVRRVVTVSYWHSGFQRVEDYGPFESPAHLVAWLEWCDEKVPFGTDAGLIRMEVKYLARVLDPPAASRTAKKTTTRNAKKAAAS